MSRDILSLLLDVPSISRVRRNHALEHATMHVLGERHRGVRLAGRSSLWGFYIYGDVSTEEVFDAVREGLRRLNAGQRRMAIHPNCGSNLAVAGTLAGLGTFLALGTPSKDRSEGYSKRLARLPLACVVATLGVMLAQPLGAALQARVTTQANVGDLSIANIRRENRAGFPVHFVRTRV